ncbi:MAG: alpha/beta fold hydrolase [Verrucomicrobiales bacterium]|nr:alpha/beta fold hydrolase [Verrucomicrobiales bacterium]
MRRRILLALFLMIFGISGFASAFPPLIAKKILDRPDFAFGDFATIEPVTEAIIKGADQIQVHKITVGKPAVALDVLIVNPRNYGFDVTGGVTKEKTFRFNVSTKNNRGEALFKEVLSAERFALFEENKDKSFSLTAGEISRLIEHHAREGNEKIVPEKSKTIFFFNGYGITNRISLVWALILAENGYQVVSPDLRGIGKSGGKGPTFGKCEAEDLKQLLTNLQQSGQVSGDSVGVIGISYGAAMASLWAAKDPRVKASVLIAPYARADNTIVTLAGAFKSAVKVPFVTDPKSVRKGTVLAARKLGVTWEELSPAKAIPAIRHPILFMTSPADKLIPEAEVKKLYQTAREGSELKSFKGIPHEIIGYNVDDAAPLILNWLDKRL